MRLWIASPYVHFLVFMYVLGADQNQYPIGSLSYVASHTDKKLAID